MTLGQKQERFSRMLSNLLTYMHSLGYEVRIGHVMRCQDCPTGHPISTHKIKLAADLNLFRDGRYLTNTEDHRQFGEYWEAMGGTWGGRFDDGNHYSLEHNGIR